MTRRAPEPRALDLIVSMRTDYFTARRLLGAPLPRLLLDGHDAEHDGWLYWSFTREELVNVNRWWQTQLPSKHLGTELVSFVGQGLDAGGTTSNAHACALTSSLFEHMGDDECPWRVWKNHEPVITYPSEHST